MEACKFLGTINSSVTGFYISLPCKAVGFVRSRENPEIT